MTDSIRTRAIFAASEAIANMPVEDQDYGSCATAAFDAIIATLMEPSEEVCRAGSQSDEPLAEPFTKPSQIWQAMLSEAAK